MCLSHTLSRKGPGGEQGWDYRYVPFLTKCIECLPRGAQFPNMDSGTRKLKFPLSFGAVIPRGTCHIWKKLCEECENVWWKCVPLCHGNSLLRQELWFQLNYIYCVAVVWAVPGIGHIEAPLSLWFDTCSLGVHYIGFSD